MESLSELTSLYDLGKLSRITGDADEIQHRAPVFHTSDSLYYYSSDIIFIRSSLNSLLSASSCFSASSPFLTHQSIMASRIPFLSLYNQYFPQLLHNKREDINCVSKENPYAKPRLPFLKNKNRTNKAALRLQTNLLFGTRLKDTSTKVSLLDTVAEIVINNDSAFNGYIDFIDESEISSITPVYTSEVQQIMSEHNYKLNAEFYEAHGHDYLFSHSAKELVCRNRELKKLSRGLHAYSTYLPESKLLPGLEDFSGAMSPFSPASPEIVDTENVCIPSNNPVEEIIEVTVAEETHFHPFKIQKFNNFVENIQEISDKSTNFDSKRARGRPRKERTKEEELEILKQKANRVPRRIGYRYQRPKITRDIEYEELIVREKVSSVKPPVMNRHKGVKSCKKSKIDFEKLVVDALNSLNEKEKSSSSELSSDSDSSSDSNSSPDFSEVRKLESLLREMSCPFSPISQMRDSEAGSVCGSSTVNGILKEMTTGVASLSDFSESSDDEDSVSHMLNEMISKVVPLKELDSELGIILSGDKNGSTKEKRLNLKELFTIANETQQFSMPDIFDASYAPKSQPLTEFVFKKPTSPLSSLTYNRRKAPVLKIRKRKAKRGDEVANEIDFNELVFDPWKYISEAEQSLVHSRVMNALKISKEHFKQFSQEFSIIPAFHEHGVMSFNYASHNASLIYGTIPAKFFDNSSALKLFKTFKFAKLNSIENPYRERVPLKYDTNVNNYLNLDHNGELRDEILSDLIISISFYKANKYQYVDCYLDRNRFWDKKMIQVEFLGQTSLCDIKKSLTCPKEFISCHSASLPLNEDGHEKNLIKEKKGAWILYIAQTVYFDGRIKGNFDLASRFSTNIKSSAFVQNKNLRLVDAQHVKLVDMEIQFGHPYILVHGLMCCHQIVFNQARVCDSVDSVAHIFPRVTFETKFKKENCRLCEDANVEVDARWIMKCEKGLMSNKLDGLRKQNYLCTPCAKLISRFKYAKVKKRGNQMNRTVPLSSKIKLYRYLPPCDFLTQPN